MFIERAKFTEDSNTLSVTLVADDGRTEMRTFLVPGLGNGTIQFT